MRQKMYDALKYDWLKNKLVDNKLFLNKGEYITITRSELSQRKM